MAQACHLKSGRLGYNSKNHAFSVEKAFNAPWRTPGESYLLLIIQIDGVSIMRSISARPLSDWQAIRRKKQVM